MFNTNHSGSANAGDVAKGLVAGLIGGLVASWAMTQLQNLLSQMGQEQSSESSGQEEGEQQQEEQTQQETSEPATVKAAAAVSDRVLHHELTEQEKSKAGTAMHYGFGTTMGGVYGVAAELAPAITAGQGLAYGTTVWLAADEVAVPALGLASPPTQHPPSTHAYALGSHLVYGLVLEAVRRLVRVML